MSPPRIDDALHAPMTATPDTAPERRLRLLSFVVPPLEPALQHWVERPYFVWGARRRLRQLMLIVGGVGLVAATVLMVAVPPKLLVTWWLVAPGVTMLVCLPLAVAFHSFLRDLDRGGLLRDLSMTPIDRRAFAKAVLRRLLRSGWGVSLSVLFVAGTLRLLGWTALVDVVNEDHLQRTVETLASCSLVLLISWHFAIVLLRLWDFVGESINNTAQYMGKFHSYVTMPLTILMIPIIVLGLFGSVPTAGVLTSCALAISAWTGDGAWGWLPTVREHPFFQPLREDEF